MSFLKPPTNLPSNRIDWQGRRAAVILSFSEDGRCGFLIKNAHCIHSLSLKHNGRPFAAAIFLLAADGVVIQSPGVRKYSSNMFKPKLLLQLEGVAVLFASCVAFHQIHGSWLWFALLLLTPDLFMLGYLVNQTIGAAAYNFAHTYTVPLLLFFSFIVYESSSLFLAGADLAGAHRHGPNAGLWAEVRDGL